MNEILIFDRVLKARHYARAARQIGQYDFLYREVADRMAETLAHINQDFPQVLELNARGPWLQSALLQQHPRIRQWETGLPCDEEYLPYPPKSFDLIISLMTLHWVNDLPGALIQLRRALKPKGLFLGTLFGAHTLKELREAQSAAEPRITGGISPRISPFAEVKEMGGLLQRASFALPVADTETITVMYPDAFALMRDLRGMGESNALLKRQKNFTPESILSAIAAEYQEKFGTADGIPATFEIITVTGWHPE